MNPLSYTLEYILGNISQKSLWRQLSTPVGLSLWLAQQVDWNQEKKSYNIFWDKNSFDTAYIAEIVEEEHIIYDIETQDGDRYRIRFDILDQELTGDKILKIEESHSDEHPDDLQLFWEKKIHQLKLSLGV